MPDDFGSPPKHRPPVYRKPPFVMFKFDFSIDDDAASDHDVRIVSTSSADVPPGSQDGSGSAPYLSVTVDELAAHLPTSITYSPLQLTFPATKDVTRTILRRDLYDARFQVMDQSAAEEDKSQADEQYVDAETDLIPGTYEGGLKTWEGGVDLVEVLEEYDGRAGKLLDRVIGKRVIEVGCGTSLPTLYLLNRLLDSPARPNGPTTVFHLQDFNLSVLQLVTLPNLILSTIPTSELDPDSDDLDLTPKVVSRFKARLREHNIELEFSYGPWTGLAAHLAGAETKQDLILTAETIYREDSVSSLIDVLKNGSTKHMSTKPEMNDLSDLDKLKLDGDWPVGETVILVAAKILYFGVGGGLNDFLNQVKTRGGDSEDIKSWPKGVGRKVVRLFWPGSN